MKKKNFQFVVFILICFPFQIFGQQNTFSKVTRDTVAYANDFIGTFDKGYLIAGGSNEKGLIFKIDSAGNVLWDKLFSNTTMINPYIAFNCAIATCDSAFLLVGSIYNTLLQKTDVACTKINSIGDTVWFKTFSSNNNYIKILSVQQTNDSGFITTGFISYSNAPYSQLFVGKLDVNGNFQWVNQYLAGDNSNTGYSIKQTADSGYIVTGYIESSPDYYAYTVLLKLQSDGTISWSKKYQLTSSLYGVEGNDIILTNDGIICYLKGALMKTDLSGNILWSRSYTSISEHDRNTPSQKIQKTKDNGFAFLSGSDLTGQNTLVKTDSAGNLQWAKRLAFIGVDMICNNKDNTFIAIGDGPIYGIKKGIGDFEIGIIKMDSLGDGQSCINSAMDSSPACTIISSSVTFTISAITEIESSVNPVISSSGISTLTDCVKGYSEIYETLSLDLISVYPNPITDNATFIVNSANLMDNYSFQLTNILGKVVKTKSGITGNQFTVSRSGLADGLYIYKIYNNKGVIGVGKIVID
jgi:hypothetical protein